MSHAAFCAEYVPVRGQVLDVGAGRGNWVVEMAKAGFTVSGIEINPDYVREAETKAKLAGVTVNLVTGPAEKLPYANNFFDFANCAEVTEHVNDPIQIGQEICRVLKNKAYAYISFHNRYGVYDYHYHLWGINWLPRAVTEPILRLLGKQKSDGENGRQKLTTMHYYRFGEVQSLLQRIGLVAIDLRVVKIKKRFGKLAPLVLLGYYTILRPLYFNTFHILVQKKI